MKRVAFIFGLVFFHSVILMKGQNTLTFTETYTGGVNPTTAQKTHWTNFIASLTSNYCYTKVRFYGSSNTSGFTITNASYVATIAADIRQGTSFQIASNGHNWQYCSNDLRIDGPAVNYCGICDAGNCLRPMSGYGGNWGGLNGNTCGAGSQTITLEFTYSTPNVNLGNDTTVCGNSLVLNAGNSGSAYQWQDGSASETFTVATSGIYYVQVSNSCGDASDTIHVDFLQTPSQPDSIFGEVDVCKGSSQTYSINNVSGATSYVWNLPSGWIGNSNTNSINVTTGNAGGVISVIATNNCGNSTTKTLSVNEIIVDTSVVLMGNTLTSNATSAIYQWVKCPTMQVVSGASSQSFTPSQNGTYAVIVSQNGCTDTSNCYNISTTGIMQIGYINSFSVYPNPAAETITVSNSSLINEGNIIVYDVLGNEVVKQQIHSSRTVELNISTLQQGVYTVKIGAEFQKFIKQ